MTRRDRVRLAVAAMCAALAVAFAVWPADWIEALTGKEPDGGDGSLERLPVLVLAAIAAALAGWILVARARRPSPGDGASTALDTVEPQR